MKLAEEIQIELDDVYACPGKCPGCVLTSEERKANEPDMSPEVRKRVWAELVDYIPTLDGLKRMNVTYGIADHFLMPTEYLVEIYKEAVATFRSVKLSGAVFMTTSLIGKSVTIREKIDALSAYSTSDVALWPIVVLDPAKMLHNSFGETYLDNIAYAKEHFGVVDLAINLSEEAVKLMGAEALVSFAKKNGFREVTINWTPTPDNITKTYSKAWMCDLVQWLQTFASLAQAEKIECSYVPVIQRAYEAWRCAMDAERAEDGLSFMPIMESLMPETLKKSLQFDHHGCVMPKLEAIGDVMHGERTELPAWGAVGKGVPLKDLVERGLHLTKAKIAKIMTSSAACRGCEFNALCATTGFHVYTHVIQASTQKIDGNDCPHVAKYLWMTQEQGRQFNPKSPSAT